MVMLVNREHGHGLVGYLSPRVSSDWRKTMTSKARTVREYLDELPQDRRAAVEAVRRVILENLNDGYEEGMQYGMIGYYVPHSLYPAGYHCDPKQPLPFACLASQKNHLSLYVTYLYGNPRHEDWFRKEWAKTGKKLDMGKSCIRFKKLEDLPLDLIGRVIARVPVKELVSYYEDFALNRVRAGNGKASVARKKTRSAPTTKKKTRKKMNARR
jgi:hypothetical protein